MRGSEARDIGRPLDVWIRDTECTTLGGAITTQSAKICVFITTISQQMADKCLEKESPFPNLHKDTSSGGAIWLLSRRISNREDGNVQFPSWTGSCWGGPGDRWVRSNQGPEKRRWVQGL